MTFTVPSLRLMGDSEASGAMKRAAVPVVFATTIAWGDVRNAPAHSRVTLDLPRMPLTMMRTGIFARFPAWRRCSTNSQTNIATVPTASSR